MLLQGIRLILSIYFSKFIFLVSLWRHTGGTYHRLRIQISGPFVFRSRQMITTRMSTTCVTVVAVLQLWTEMLPTCTVQWPGTNLNASVQPQDHGPTQSAWPEYCQWVPTMKSFLPVSPVCQWERLTATASNLLRKIFRNSIIKNKIMANNNIYLFLFPSG